MQNDVGVNLSSQKAALISLFNSGGRGAVLYLLVDDQSADESDQSKTAPLHRCLNTTAHLSLLNTLATCVGTRYWRFLFGCDRIRLLIVIKPGRYKTAPRPPELNRLIKAAFCEDKFTPTSFCIVAAAHRRSLDHQESLDTSPEIQAAGRSRWRNLVCDCARSSHRPPVPGPAKMQQNSADCGLR